LRNFTLCAKSFVKQYADLCSQLSIVNLVINSPTRSVGSW